MKKMFAFLRICLFLSLMVQCLESQEYWKAWKSYKTIIVEETESLDRLNEPIEISLTFRNVEMSRPEQEIRMAELSENGSYNEIPCQVFGIKTVPDSQLIQCRIVFLASVSANERKTYRVFYNNQAAPVPSYSSDLKVSGEGLGLMVENAYYKADLTPAEGPRKNPDSGQIKEITIWGKQHQILTRFNRRMHWSPNFLRTDNKNDQSIAQWDKPEHYIIEQGPIMCLTKRWGSLKDFPEIFITAVYKFYAHQPYFIYSSRMEMNQDIQLNRLRNDEMTMDSMFTHLAFKRPDGSLVTTTFQHRDEILAQHPIEADAPWVCFYESDKGFAYGSIRLFYDNTNIWGEASPTTGDYTKISNSAKGGKYWNRILILDNPTLIPKGSVYAEKNVYIVFKLREGENRLAEIEQYAQRLRHPLKVKLLNAEL